MPDCLRIIVYVTCRQALVGVIKYDKKSFSLHNFNGLFPLGPGEIYARGVVRACLKNHNVIGPCHML